MAKTELVGARSRGSYESAMQVITGDAKVDGLGSLSIPRRGFPHGRGSLLTASAASAVKHSVQVGPPSGAIGANGFGG